MAHKVSGYLGGIERDTVKCSLVSWGSRTMPTLEAAIVEVILAEHPHLRRQGCLS